MFLRDLSVSMLGDAARRALRERTEVADHVSKVDRSSRRSVHVQAFFTAAVLAIVKFEVLWLAWTGQRSVGELSQADLIELPSTVVSSFSARPASTMIDQASISPSLYKHRSMQLILATASCTQDYAQSNTIRSP